MIFTLSFSRGGGPECWALVSQLGRREGIQFLFGRRGMHHLPERKMKIESPLFGGKKKK
jgi:hypothetical protein